MHLDAKDSHLRACSISDMLAAFKLKIVLLFGDVAVSVDSCILSSSPYLVSLQWFMTGFLAVLQGKSQETIILFFEDELWCTGFLCY